MSGARKLVAELLSTSEEEAGKFCLQVQACFKGQVPSFYVIAKCLENHPTAGPDEIAEFLRGTWSGTSKVKRPKEKVVKLGGWGHSAIDASTGGSMMMHDPRRHIQGLEKCPHGVLIGKKCALCDPEGWRQDTGWDY